MARADLALAASPAVRSDRFASMGNTAHVVVLADSDETTALLISRARVWITALEQSWSRFVPTSDVYRLNTARGKAVCISPDTAVLVRHLIAAFETTDGLFNPFVLPALVDAGYTHSLAGDGAQGCPVESVASAASREHVVLESINGETWCRLIGGATLDPGGLGKGLAADIIAERLLLDGALGALVSIGGDVRCIGVSPDPAGWVIEIESLCHPAHGVPTAVLMSGAIATSSTHAKRWHGGHHVIDPSTGKPLDQTGDDALRMSSVIASSAVWAEVFATATLVAGAQTAGLMIEARGLAARFERTNGRPIVTAGFERFAS